MALMDDDRDMAIRSAAKITALAAARRQVDIWSTKSQAIRNSLTQEDTNPIAVHNARQEQMRWEQAIRNAQSEVLLHGQVGWPSRLFRSRSADPALLHMRGELPPDTTPTAGVVGSRRASTRALQAAHEIGEHLGQHGVVLVSGLAAGVDTAAHEGALAANGVNIAVVGTGIDICFPPENADLSERIAATGVVISQFPPGLRGSKTTFPARNGVVASLSDVVVVVAATETSGTRITMNKATDETAHGKTPVLIWEPTVGRQEWISDWADRKRDAGHTVVFTSSCDEIVALAREVALAA